MMKTGSTYCEIYYHVVFATKRRQKILDRETIQKIAEIARQKAEECGFLVHILNGYTGHIHILMSVPPKMALAKAIKDIKGPSSRAIPELTWRRGYYVKTIHKEIVDDTYHYIQTQWQRHSRQKLEAEMEFIPFLPRN